MILETCETLILVVVSLLQGVQSRECYNYKEEPAYRQCSHGCCGDDYEEFCCDATMQIMGSVLGGLVVIGVVIAVAVYCYTKKSKRNSMVSGGGILGRMGLRNRNQGHLSHQQTLQHTAHNVRTGPPQVPRGRAVFRIPTNHNHSPIGGTAFYNPTYSPNSVPTAPPVQYPYQPSGNQMYPPTAPMPPPYEMTVAPPPYSDNKGKGHGPPPPPEYSSYIGHMSSQGCKPGEYSDGMPPPAY